MVPIAKHTFFKKKNPLIPIAVHTFLKKEPPIAIPGMEVQVLVGGVGVATGGGFSVVLPGGVSISFPLCW